MNKKIVYRVLAALLSVVFVAAGIFLLTPVFDRFLNKLNGVAFIILAIYMIRYSFTGKEKLFVKKNKRGVRPSKVDNSSECKSRSGKVGQPPDSKHRADGSNSKC